VPLGRFNGYAFTDLFVEMNVCLTVDVVDETAFAEIMYCNRTNTSPSIIDLWLTHSYCKIRILASNQILRRHQRQHNSWLRYAAHCCNGGSLVIAAGMSSRNRPY